MSPTRQVAVAVPVPLFGAFSYGLPDAVPEPEAGCRVRVPFGRRELVGVVVDGPPAPYAGRIRPLVEVLDDTPVLPADLLRFLTWAAAYYHHPLGEVVQHALPVGLRGVQPEPTRELGFAATAAADTAALARAPRQRQALRVLQAWLAEGHGRVCPRHVLTAAGVGPAALRALEGRGFLVREALPTAVYPGQGEPAPHAFTAEQSAAVAQLSGPPGFRCALLEGVTGSGKTEVYLALMLEAIRAGRQCLLLVPEIGLTPQLVHRVAGRLPAPVAVLHSGLSDRQRLEAWRAARDGRARAVVGTRSAVFTPLPELGLVIVDEEHDASYKQQDGFRYSARDLAIKRAQDSDVGVVLGSATSSLETLAKALSGRYGHARLQRRTSPHPPPRFRFVDLRTHPAPSGLAQPVLDAMSARLEAGEQCLVFLNRRGYAPVLICQACAWTADCDRCSAHYTLHQAPPRLTCHHCDRRLPVPVRCPACGSDRLGPVGFGTQRLARLLAQRFGTERILRLDRDVADAGGLAAGLARLHAGDPCVVVGTQLLAKGHDFPLLTLVAVANADGGLFSHDFRGIERAAQLITQVAGRAGRAERPGEVWLQTLQPEHPALRQLAASGYGAVARAQLEERRATRWPPFGHLALLRAEATRAGAAETVLEKVAADLGELAASRDVALLGPVPAPMERRQGRFRAQLLLSAEQRPALHTVLTQLEPVLGRRGPARLSLDVDPLDTY